MMIGPVGRVDPCGLLNPVKFQKPLTALLPMFDPACKVGVQVSASPPMGMSATGIGFKLRVRCRGLNITITPVVKKVRPLYSTDLIDLERCVLFALGRFR